MKLVFWARIAEAALGARLGAIPGLDVTVVRRRDELAAALPSAQALVMAGGDYTAGVADIVRANGATLRLIQLLTAGYEGLEEHGVPPGVTVANAGDSWSPAVAEHAVALMLALGRGIPAAIDAQKAGRWTQSSLSPGLRSLHGRTLVVVGWGSIGRETAVRVRAFGMRVVGVSRRALPDPLLDESHAVIDLDTVLSRADVVLVTVPAGARTRGLIGARQLAACPKGALLINVARGNVVDRAALMAALDSGHLGGAGIDVTDPEPLGDDDPLWRTPNLLITPHVSGATGPAGMARLADIVGANVERFVRGEAPRHLVSLGT